MKIGLTFNNEQKSNIILLNFTLKSGKKTEGLECCIVRLQLAIGVNEITSTSKVSISRVFPYCVDFLVGPNFQAHSSISITLLSLTIASAGNLIASFVTVTLTVRILREIRHFRIEVYLGNVTVVNKKNAVIVFLFSKAGQYVAWSIGGYFLNNNIK